jgi:Cyclin D1 binding domain
VHVCCRPSAVLEGKLSCPASQMLGPRTQSCNNVVHWRCADASINHHAGDPNVPAGEISFTAPIGRDKRLDVSEYPEVMGVTGRYAGRGLVAQQGFTEPRCAARRPLNRSGPNGCLFWLLARNAVS